ncbi:MAG: shikimate dehydrogenase, partial [Synechococcaceae cyanobacterium SM2_3_60]|nr:shikimate dehydrogenase [Synechococcaceae cyanobacterium SM2_3_60]
LDAVYVPFPVKAADLGAAVAGLGALGVRGFNVTIPHKQAVMPYLAEVTDLAQAVGAVNTVYRLPRALGPVQTPMWPVFVSRCKGGRGWVQQR